MAEQVAPPQQSIQARIAALNIGQVGRAPITATQKTSPRPPVPPPRPAIDRSSTANIPLNSTLANGIGNEPATHNGRTVLPPPVGIIRTGQVNGHSNSAKPAPPPRLPPRKQSTLTDQKSPALPPRRPSNQLVRQESQESLSSVVSTLSTVSALSNGTSRTANSIAPSMDGSRVRAPVFDPASLPPLPPKRSEQEKEKTNGRIPLKGAKSTSVLPIPEITSRKMPELPQRPNGREVPSLPSRETVANTARKLPPMNIPTVTPVDRSGPPPSIPNGTRTNGVSSLPPPIPVGTRPDLSKLLATKPKMPASVVSSAPMSTPAAEPACLTCRDFSAPDAHAAKFPKESVPSLDWLAAQLTSPFPSVTDKARAIFTWLHHNISYDVYSFFNNCVKRKTPQETLTSGLAVCEGYASLFTALATKAGLESVVVSGHGKGYSFTTLKAGDPLPPFKCGHAWNAVKIDDGEWKLIDSCWGAGNICDRNGPKLYNKQFSPEMFTYDNETFGLRHFPENPAYFFRNDGRATIPWEEYVTGGTLDPQEPVLVYSNIAPEEGFKSSKFLPKNLNISTNPAAHSSPTVRFQFERICPHWDPIKDGPGKPFQYFLACGIGADGHYKDAIPFDNNGKFWWCDAPVNRLGKAGDKVMVYCVKTIENRDGRGLTAQEYLKKKGKVAMSFGCAACWELV